jgi:hypothetical protein
MLANDSESGSLSNNVIPQVKEGSIEDARQFLLESVDVGAYVATSKLQEMARKQTGVSLSAEILLEVAASAALPRYIALVKNPGTFSEETFIAREDTYSISSYCFSSIPLLTLILSLLARRQEFHRGTARMVLWNPEKQAKVHITQKPKNRTYRCFLSIRLLWNKQRASQEPQLKCVSVECPRCAFLSVAR